MRGCGTVFKDDPDDEQQLYEAVERMAAQWEFRAAKLRTAIQFCRNKSSTEGLLQMVAYAFNANQYTPNFGGGADQLPPGKYKGVAVNSGGSDTKDNQGGFIFFELTPIEGPLTGRKQTLRFNVHNTNKKTVEIANEQLSAFSLAVGRPQWNQSEELHNLPFIFDVDWQRGQEPTADKPNGGYTEVKAIYDVNGNKPGAAANGPQQTMQQPNNGGGFGGPAGGVQPSNPGAAQGFGGGQQQGGFGQQGGGDPNAGQGGFGGAGQQQGGFGGQQQGQGQGGGFGAQGGQPQGGGFGQGQGQQQQGGGFGGGQAQGGWSQGQGGNGQGWNNN